MLALIFKPVIANENGVGMPAPLTDQSRAETNSASQIGLAGRDEVGTPWENEIGEPAT